MLPRADFLLQLRSLRQTVVEGGLHPLLLGLYEFGHRYVTGAPPQRYSRITPQLYVSGQHRRHGWAQLAALGITAVVNLRQEYDDAAAGIAPLRYLYLPTIDATPPSLEHLRAGVEFIRQEIARGGKVYVHCAAGIGRAPTLAAAYLVSTGLTPTQAWQHILLVRPFVRPTHRQKAIVERFAEQQGDKDQV
ncbi:MAG: dual specificity protein phosphatase family protein [Chloroflexi bacterium]|nr:dual specificity protein phosphatase family protein [Chloroflexota bacterium]